MNNNGSKRVEEILQSMKGSQRAKPDSKLLMIIQEKITGTNTIMTLHQLMKYAAAAVLILLMNTSILIFMHQNSKNKMNQDRVHTLHKNEMFNNFQIYEL